MHISETLKINLIIMTFSTLREIQKLKGKKKKGKSYFNISPLFDLMYVLNFLRGHCLKMSQNQVKLFIQ